MRTDHFEGTSSGESGEAVSAEELASGDAHDGRCALGALGEDGVAHGMVDLVRVLNRNGFVELLVDLGYEGRPIRLQIELGRP